MPVRIKFPVRESVRPELRRMDPSLAAVQETKLRLDDLGYDPSHMKRR